MSKYINLIVHSNYSFLESTLTINQIVDFAVKNKCEYASLIDINVMYGAIEFYDLCLKNNIKPIIGLHVKYKNDNYVLIAKNYSGYRSLLVISSIIMTDANKLWKDYINDDLFIIDTTNKDENTLHIEDIACQEIYHLNDADYPLYIVLQAIKNEQIINLNLLNNSFDIDHLMLNDNEFYERFNSKQLNNLNDIIEQINLEFPIDDKSNIVKYNSPNNLSSKEYLNLLVKEKLDIYLNANPKLNKKEYYERVKFELEIINTKGFDDYFLVVQDFINWAKSNQIMIGPGRGSAAGSLVAFCLNITELDPIKYNLLFERFLNIDRVYMPDIDVDVMDSKRDQLINYLFDKYGFNHVAHIITFSKIKAKQAIRDVGRVLGVNLNTINLISKNIKSEFETDILKAILEPDQFPKYTKNLNILKSEFISNKELFTISQQLIGFYRQAGTHAAGIILSNKKITDYVAIQSTLNNKIMTQTSMEYLENLGLIKIDILGLRNLTMIDNIIKLINHRHNVKIDLLSIDLEDKNVFKLFQEGNTNEIFQFDSPGMKRTLKRIKPTSLEDLSIVSAIYRPGANENIDLYLKNKQSNEITYFNKEIEDVLKPTYGIIIYQEQIIKLVQIIAKFDKFKADNFRKAISKKKEDMILASKEEFIDGALKNGYSLQQAEYEFYNMLKFAYYGFNHSHSLSYALISYWMAYLKTYYPLETISVFLTYGDIDEYKMKSYLAEAKNLNIEIKLPDINLSSTSFVLYKNNIIFSFLTINGLGVETANKIIELREDQPDQKFTDAVKTIAKLNNTGISKSLITNLIKAGAFDNLESNRNFLLANIDVLCDKKLNVLDVNNNFVFNINLNTNVQNDISNYYLYEKEVLGISFNDSLLKILFDKYQLEYNLMNINQIETVQNFNTLIQITNVVKKTAKTNKTYLLISFLENDKSYNAVVFNLINQDENDFVEGKYYIVNLQNDEKSSNFKLNRIVKEIDTNGK